MALLITVSATSRIGHTADHDWVTISGGGRGAEYQIDTLSIQRDRTGVVRAWVKATGNKDRLIEAEEKSIGGIFSGFKARSKYSDYSHSLSIWEVDCNLRTGGSGRYVAYDRNGSPIESSDFAPTHRPIVPETIMETFFKRVC